MQCLKGRWRHDELATIPSGDDMKIARCKLYGYDYIVEWHKGMGDDSDWIQLSELVEVEFVDLPPEKTIPPQIAFIDEGIKKIREEMLGKIARLEDEKSKLLALTHEVTV